MKHTKMYRLMVVLSAGLPILLLAGCFELGVVTAVTEDGRGARSMEMLISSQHLEEEETGITIQDLQALYGFSRDKGWSLSEEESGSELVHAFRRQSRTDDLADWAEPRQDIYIRGTVEKGPYQEVAFRNSVQVWTEETPGGRKFKYREKFFWDGLGDALIDSQVDEYRESLRAQYPKLTPQQVGELLGLFRGGYWAAVGEGMYKMSDKERASRFGPLADRMTEQAVKTVRQAHPEADGEYLSNMAFKIVIERDERDEDFLQEKLLGATLALLTELRVLVSLPGQIVDSNASSREGSALLWRIEPGDAVDNPIEIYAESVVRD